MKKKDVGGGLEDIIKDWNEEKGCGWRTRGYNKRVE